MKEIRFILACLLLVLWAGNKLQAQQLTILHTNDMHSKLQGYGLEREHSQCVPAQFYRSD